MNPLHEPGRALPEHSLCYSFGALQDLHFYRFMVWETMEKGELKKHSTQTGMAMLLTTASSWNETKEDLYSAHKAHLETPNGSAVILEEEKREKGNFQDAIRPPSSEVDRQMGPEKRAAARLAESSLSIESVDEHGGAERLARVKSWRAKRAAPQPPIRKSTADLSFTTT